MASAPQDRSRDRPTADRPTARTAGAPTIATESLPLANQAPTHTRLGASDMAAARLTALLEGDHEKRSAAFGELTALANGDDVDATTNLSTASVHVGGLDGELEDEEKLAEMFGRFGTVLAVTLRTRNEVQDGAQVVSWSLLTFAEEGEARKAVAGAEELGGALVVRSLDTQQALGSSGAMGQVMRTHRTRVKVGVAAACVAPLIKVLCADLSDVGVVEYQTASLLLGELICLDPVQVRNHLGRSMILSDHLPRT